MNTKIQLLTGTFAVLTIGAYANLLGAPVAAPADTPSLTPADTTIVTVTQDAPNAYRFTAGAVGKTTVTFAAGGVSAEINVEVLDAGAPTAVAFSVGPIAPVHVADAELNQPAA
jgi:hypothetical protein